MKRVLPILFCFLAVNGFSQDNSGYAISENIELPRYGWNKVLQAKNGNTVLIHLENEKGIVVKIFDKAHKEIAGGKRIVKCLKFSNALAPVFKGLYDINGEAVLFIEHVVDNRNSLIRFRFDESEGKLIEEKALVVSAGLGNKTYSYVLKEKNSDNYSVFYYRNIKRYAGDGLELVKYSGGHEVIKKVNLDVDKKDYEYMGLGGISITPTGDICIAFNLENNKVQGSRANNSTYSRDIGIYYLPRDADHFTATMTKVDDDAYVYRAIVTENPVSKKLNLLLSTRRDIKQNRMYNWVMELKSYLLTLNENDLSETKGNMVTYNTIRNYLRQNVDSAENFYGVPVNMYTGENGVTTIVSEEYYRSNEIGNGYNTPNTILGYVGLTQYDDKGEEISGVVLPKIQYVTRGPDRISSIDYFGQFSSVRCKDSKGVLYVFYNDNKRNYDNSLESPGTPVYEGFRSDAFAYTDAFYYKVNSNMEMRKKYLFGVSAKGESRSCDLASADFDETTKSYATIMLYRNGKDITTHLAWCRLD